jgi:hypothetical protein
MFAGEVLPLMDRCQFVLRCRGGDDIGTQLPGVVSVVTGTSKRSLRCYNNRGW